MKNSGLRHPHPKVLGVWDDRPAFKAIGRSKHNCFRQRLAPSAVELHKSYLNTIPLQRKQGDLLQVKMLEALVVHL
jgi:hypothetical protein